jgi:two-component sensor histidine kinase
VAGDCSLCLGPRDGIQERVYLCRSEVAIRQWNFAAWLALMNREGASHAFIISCRRTFLMSVTDGVDRPEPLATHQQRIQVLAEFGQDALQSPDLQELLDLAVVRVAQAIKVSHTKLMRYRSETADLLIVAGTGWHPGVVGRARLRIDLDSPAGRALQTGTAVAIDDLPNSEEFRVPAILTEHRIVSATNVPLFVDGAVWGVLEVDSDQLRSFGMEDTHFLTAFAAFLGAAIHRRGVEQQLSDNLRTEVKMAAEAKILLRELQHRVKNNLQIILSLISMQKRKAASDEARTALSHIGERVTAISLAQDQLSFDQHLRSVNLGAYLRALCAYMETGRDDVVIDVTAEDVDVATEQALPCGLIVNEAVTNAVKHGFAGEGGGGIRVVFGIDKASREATVTILDNGIGMAQAKPRSSGIDLMYALAKQIAGSINYTAGDGGLGTCLILQFPLRL